MTCILTNVHPVYRHVLTPYIDSWSPSLQTHELLPMFCTAFVLFQRIIWTVELVNSFSCALQYLLLHAIQWILHYHQLCSTALCINNANMESIAREEREMVISWRIKKNQEVCSFICAYGKEQGTLKGVKCGAKPGNLSLCVYCRKNM